TLSALDVDGDSLTYSVTPPAHGTLTGLAPNLIYHPAPNYNGPDSFTFKANDGHVDSAVASVSINVVPVNDPPVPHAEISTLLVLSPGQSNLFILSPNGSNAAVLLDGSLSMDPDNDPLQYLWLADGSLMPFADGVLATNVLPVGSHDITLVV